MYPIEDKVLEQFSAKKQDLKSWWQGEIGDKVSFALSNISSQESKCLMYFYFWNHSDEDTAKRLSVTREEAKSRRESGLKNVAKQLEQDVKTTAKLLYDQRKIEDLR